MKVVRLIDRGGFGIVHEVKTPEGKRFARKSFDPQGVNADEQVKLKRRFAREVRVQSQISHPNIMPILTHDLDASPPWFIMPLAEQSLQTKIEADRSAETFDPEPWQDILAAIEELHRLGYVHRDLKPANILYVNGKWLLSDFGLILPTTRDTTILTSSHSAYGSHYYAAPEQALDFRNTPEQADIFALGCILHDAVDHDPVRTPFAQIRTDGVYGPFLEKCTEIDPKRRFPTIAAVRAALFELWRTSEYSAPNPDENTFLDRVLSSPDSVEAWRALLRYIENLELEDRGPILQAMTVDLIVSLNRLDDALYGRMMTLICAWASGSGFEWSYCDIVGDRLLEAYKISSVRIKCQVVMATMELAVSHNRWHVMNQVGAMLGPIAENGLVDRMLIEIKLDHKIEKQLRTIEEIIGWARDRWHEIIASFLNEADERRDAAPGA